MIHGGWPIAIFGYAAYLLALRTDPVDREKRRDEATKYISQLEKDLGI